MDKFKHEFNLRAGDIEHQICLYLQDDDTIFLVSGPTLSEESNGLYYAEFVIGKENATPEQISISTKFRSYSDE